MATAFVSTVEPSGGDYTSLATASTGALAKLACDLTSAATKVFSISAKTNPTIADGDAVTGNTSGATGTCVHVNVAGTQILIKSISGTFQSGETVKKSSDAGVTVTLSNAGDSAIVKIVCGNVADTANRFDANSVYTTSTTNYLWVTASTNHGGKWSTSSYRWANEHHESMFVVGIGTILEGLQLKCAGSGSYGGQAVECLPNSVAGTGYVFKRCIFVGAFVGTGSSGNLTGIIVAGQAGNDPDILLENCLFYDWARTNQSVEDAGAISGSYCNVTMRNCTIVNCYYGHKGTGFAYTGKFYNVLFQDCGTDIGTPGGTLTGNYNLTSKATLGNVPGANSIANTTLTFVDKTNKDFHLAASDTAAIGAGDDLSGYFTTDIDGDTYVNWSIGADDGPEAAASTFVPRIIMIS